MPTTPYQRTVEELRERATLFWPEELSKREAEISIIPIMLQTQDDFVSILSVPVAGIERLFDVLTASSMSVNLFVKHLVVLADFGGEMLQRINAQAQALFPDGNFQYRWEGEQQTYHFKQFPIPGTLDNARLGISGKKLLEPQSLMPLQQDVIALLILGSSASDETVASVLAKCEIGNYIGHKDKLERFLKQRYIWVSRITGGAQSNSLGQLAQEFVADYLDEHLGIAGLEIKRNGHIPHIRHTDDRRLTTFDLVLSFQQKHIAVEVSFQVTTNSVIERKAGQAQARYEQIQKAGCKIAYVLDGAGNFQRESALRTLCAYSHCTVAFSPTELDTLCQFIRDYFSSADRS
ncbi:MAG: restriction endonuclease [Anaerolineae bacterium]|nr:restriction endonuclease [Anaerolineae bacterium]